MSLIRINPPGQPIVHIDLGAARGRVSYAASGSLGGPLIYERRVKPTLDMHNLDRFIDSQRAQGVYAERCGKIMSILGIACGRRVGHRDECRSPEAVARDTARRRARHR